MRAHAISEAVGGEAAALALESLVAAGVAPDAGCYRSALRACAATEDSAQGERSDRRLTMLWEDACSSGMMDSRVLRTLRVRSSAGLLREILRTAQSHELIISPHVLESVMLCCASSSKPTTSHVKRPPPSSRRTPTMCGMAHSGYHG